MEHAKKMVLVPQDSLERIRAKKEEEPMPSVQTPGDPIRRLDADLSEILNSGNPQEDDERWKLYRETLRRFLFFVSNSRIKEDQQSSPAADDEDSATEKALSSELIVSSVPSTYRRQSKLLLDFLLSAASGRIKWDSKGEVSIDGRRLPGANIVDLVNDAARSRKSVKSTGRVEFAKLLRELRPPREFIGNASFWKDQPATSTPYRTTHNTTFESFRDAETGDYSGDADDEGKTLQNKTQADGNSSRKRRKTRSASRWLSMSLEK